MKQDQDVDLVERVRRALSSRADVREVRMFGGLAFMVDERLAVSAQRSGDLLVSVNPADHNSHLDRGAEPAVMRNGRAMGDGWLTVAASRIPDDETLSFWITVGIHSRD